MNTDNLTETHEQSMARELQALFNARRDAEARVRRAESELTMARTEAERATLRYKRQTLWIQADEMRKNLAKVENEAASIRMALKEDA